MSEHQRETVLWATIMLFCFVAGLAVGDTKRFNVIVQDCQQQEVRK